MIEYILAFFGAFTLVIVYSAVFLMGYHAAARQVSRRSSNAEDRSDEGFAFSSSRLSYNWNLSAEEIDKIDDWEEFEEKAEE